MLEQINIIERYDETPKNRGQMSLFLEEMYSQLDELEKEMRKAAKELDFEKAAKLRDRIKELKEE